MKCKRVLSSAVVFAVAAALVLPALAQTTGAAVGTAPGKAGVVQTVKATAAIPRSTSRRAT